MVLYKINIVLLAFFALFSITYTQTIQQRVRPSYNNEGVIINSQGAPAAQAENADGGEKRTVKRGALYGGYYGGYGGYGGYGLYGGFGRGYYGGWPYGGYGYGFDYPYYGYGYGGYGYGYPYYGGIGYGYYY